MKRLATFLLSLILALPAAAEVATWKIDPAHSTAEFSVRHLMVSRVKGRFEKLSGTVVGDLSDPTGAKVEVTIDAASIDTANADRDDHLRSADFFEVETWPTITFVSKRIEKGGKGLRMIGDLTMHGVTREVTLEVEGPARQVQAGRSVRSGASATTRINRRDFGLTWNRAVEAGGIAVGNDIDIGIEVELIRQDPPPATAAQFADPPPDRDGSATGALPTSRSR
ncbi:MAG TPA: YceI family protein [Thermoanaerobaculia bacterium]|nr:YceI family protein [Thermoanaerobaculia bacterium]